MAQIYSTPASPEERRIILAFLNEKAEQLKVLTRLARQNPNEADTKLRTVWLPDTRAFLKLRIESELPLFARLSREASEGVPDWELYSRGPHEAIYRMSRGVKTAGQEYLDDCYSYFEDLQNILDNLIDHIDSDCTLLIFRPPRFSQ